MATKLVPYRREQTGLASADRMQLAAQQAAQKFNGLAGSYALIAVPYAYAQANVTTTSASFVDLAGLSVTFSAQPGDTLLIDFTALGGATVGVGQTRIAVVDGASTYTTAMPDGASLGASGSYPSTTSTSCSSSAVWKVRTKGQVTVKVQGLCSGGGQLVINATATSLSGGSPMLRVQQMRVVS